MENKKLPWKNLTEEQENPQDKRDMKESLMHVLQNFAMFTIDPDEFVDVRIKKPWVSNLFIFIGFSNYGMKLSCSYLFSFFFIQVFDSLLCFFNSIFFKYLVS